MKMRDSLSAAPLLNIHIPSFLMLSGVVCSRASQPRPICEAVRFQEVGESEEKGVCAPR